VLKNKSVFFSEIKKAKGSIFSPSLFLMDLMLPLDARRPAFGKCAHLFYGRHGRVAGKGGKQCPVRPAEIYGFLGLFARKKTVEKAGREPVPAADAVKNVHVTRR
jgi:hypothetical protein